MPQLGIALDLLPFLQKTGGHFPTRLPTGEGAGVCSPGLLALLRARSLTTTDRRSRQYWGRTDVSEGLEETSALHWACSSNLFFGDRFPAPSFPLFACLLIQALGSGSLFLSLNKDHTGGFPEGPLCSFTRRASSEGISPEEGATGPRLAPGGPRPPRLSKAALPRPGAGHLRVPTYTQPSVREGDAGMDGMLCWGAHFSTICGLTLSTLVGVRSPSQAP